MSLAQRKKPPIQSLRILGEKAYGLTPRQEAFALAYATENISQAEAARRAGYSHGAWAGSRLMSPTKNPHVLRRVVELKHELSRKYEVTFENHIKKLAEIRDMALADKNYSSAVAAEKNRGQVAGLYIARHEIMIGKIDQMSRDEVMAEIKRLHDEFPILAESSANQLLPLVEDVTFEEVEPVSDDADDEAGYEPDSKELGNRSRSLEEPPRRDDETRSLDEDRGPRRNWGPRSERRDDGP